LELARRSLPGTIAHLVLFASVQFTLAAGGPLWFRLTCSGLAGVLLILRLWVSGMIRDGRRTPRLRRTLFAVGAIGMPGIWGLLEAGQLATRGATLELFVIGMIVNGTAMATIVSMAPAVKIQQTSLAFMLGMAPLVDFVRGECSSWAVMNLVFLAYAAVQGRATSREYWRSLGTSDLLARHAASLRAAIAEREKMEEQLRFAERMASLGTLAAGVAHEINNPMTYVLSNLDYVAEELTNRGAPAWGDAEPSLEKLIAEAQDGAGRVVKIVRDLKAFSRHSDDDPLTPIALERALDIAAEMATSHIRRRATLERYYQGSTKVMGNDVRLGQVFVNLVINAAQAIPEGGDPSRHRIALRTYFDDEGRAVAEVEDSGAGIDPEVLPRVFDPFFTTKPVGVGTGLGLSSAMGIVSALGGTIDIDSAIGAGTRVRVRLPSLRDAPPRRAAPP
jgi:signal transduction histidine kinase